MSFESRNNHNLKNVSKLLMGSNNPSTGATIRNEGSLELLYITIELPNISIQTSFPKITFEEVKIK